MASIEDPAVVGSGTTVQAAQAEAYRVVSQIRIAGAWYRTDMGYHFIGWNCGKSKPAQRTLSSDVCCVEEPGFQA